MGLCHYIFFPGKKGFYVQAMLYSHHTENSFLRLTHYTKLVGLRDPESNVAAASYTMQGYNRSLKSNVGLSAVDKGLHYFRWHKDEGQLELRNQ